MMTGMLDLLNHLVIVILFAFCKNISICTYDENSGLFDVIAM